MNGEKRDLRELGQALPWRRRRGIVRELETHLEDSRIQLQLQGMTESEADLEARRRFGEPSEIAGAFSEAYRPSGRTRFVLAAGLAGGMLLGVYGLGGSFANANSTHHSGHRAVNTVRSTVSHQRSAELSRVVAGSSRVP